MDPRTPVWLTRRFRVSSTSLDMIEFDFAFPRKKISDADLDFFKECKYTLMVCFQEDIVSRKPLLYKVNMHKTNSPPSVNCY